MTKSNTQSKKGFTIIEVVLVLAIAGLIFLMVFIALPALQRSQRDTQRRDDMARVATAINQYQANNNGKLPTEGETFVSNYLRVGGDEFVDPSGEPYSVVFVSNIGEGEAKNDLKKDGNQDTSSFQITVYTKATCDGGEKAVAANNSRDYAIVYKMEGAGTYCSDSGSTKKEQSS